MRSTASLSLISTSLAGAAATAVSGADIRDRRIAFTRRHFNHLFLFPDRERRLNPCKSLKAASLNVSIRLTSAVVDPNHHRSCRECVTDRRSEFVRQRKPT